MSSSCPSPQPSNQYNPAAAVELLLSASIHSLNLYQHQSLTENPQANPKLATLKDDDDRLPIHWAVSSNHLPIVEILVSRRDFEPDVQVRRTTLTWMGEQELGVTLWFLGWLRLDSPHDRRKPPRRGRGCRTPTTERSGRQRKK